MGNTALNNFPQSTSPTLPVQASSSPCSDLVTVNHATVTCKLDYCKSLYMGLCMRLTQKFQLVQNVVVQGINSDPSRSRYPSRAEPASWAPSGVLDLFKVLVQIFKALYDQGPMYFWDYFSRYAPRRTVHSNKQNLLVIRSPEMSSCPPLESGSFLPYVMNYSFYIYCSCFMLLVVILINIIF